jgi:uncharacterized protein YxjI
VATGHEPLHPLWVSSPRFGRRSIGFTPDMARRRGLAPLENKGGPPSTRRNAIMGLLDRKARHDDQGVRRFQMREKLVAIGDDYWIEDESGNRAYKVDGKALRVRDTFELHDASGRVAAKIQERKLRVRDSMKIERPAGDAVVRKALVGIRDRFKIEVDGGPELKAQGNLVDHEYEIESDGDTVATVSKKWFRVRESYGVEIQPGQDEALILAVTVCVDALTRG